MKRKKVLFFMPHAPHYREPFLRSLSHKYDLTISARSCSTFNLIEPTSRGSYKYQGHIEFKPLARLKLFFLQKEIPLFYQEHYDVIICCLSFRYPLRILMFFLNTLRHPKSKWIWYGHFFGQTNSKALYFLIKTLVNLSSGALTYTTDYVTRLVNIGCHRHLVQSFNNSEVQENDIKQLPFKNISEYLHILFIGSYRADRQIERLLALVKRQEFIKLKLVGPKMEVLNNEAQLITHSRVKIYPPVTGDDLLSFLEWSHIVASPGKVGLLVVTAARGSRPIVIDSNGHHGPEYIIAQEAGQHFIDWSNDEVVDNYFKSCFNGDNDLKELGFKLGQHVRQNYTIEKMAKTFSDTIDSLF